MRSLVLKLRTVCQTESAVQRAERPPNQRRDMEYGTQDILAGCGKTVIINITFYGLNNY